MLSTSVLCDPERFFRRCIEEPVALTRCENPIVAFHVGVVLLRHDVKLVILDKCYVDICAPPPATISPTEANELRARLPNQPQILKRF